MGRGLPSNQEVLGGPESWYPHLGAWPTPMRCAQGPVRTLLVLRSHSEAVIIIAVTAVSCKAQSWENGHGGDLSQTTCGGDCHCGLLVPLCLWNPSMEPRFLTWPLCKVSTGVTPCISELGACSTHSGHLSPSQLLLAHPVAAAHQHGQYSPSLVQIPSLPER